MTPKSLWFVFQLNGAIAVATEGGFVGGQREAGWGILLAWRPPGIE
jgi:hypothetical protein